MTEPTDPYVDEVRRKARRLARGRAPQQSVWVALARAGAVGWQLVLPLVAGAVAGSAAGRATGWKAAPLIGLLTGLVLGLWQAAHAIARGIEPDDEEPG